MTHLLNRLRCLCILLEDLGYIYYRKNSTSGSATGGVFMELDRLTRPSIEHVIQVKTSQVKEERDRAGDDE